MKDEYKTILFSLAFICGMSSFVVGSMAYNFYYDLITYAIAGIIMISCLIIMILIRVSVKNVENMKGE